MNETCQCPPEAGAATCELGTTTTSTESCPACLNKGKPVNVVTLKALLAVPLTEVREVDYRFCRTRSCPVVYYSSDGRQRFREQDIRERVFQKHSTDDGVFVCYCFRHTLGDIRREEGTRGGDTVITAITAGIQAGQCACDIRNPQGSCCLGNVRGVVANLGRT